jgi:hypothetical protein
MLKWHDIFYRCRITETGGLFWFNYDKWHTFSGDIYKAILFDNVKVFKLYHPSDGDRYYMPCFSFPSKCSEGVWGNCKYEVWAYEHGLVCKTKEEAQELADKLANYAKKIRS